MIPPIPVERAECPDCEGAIPHTNILVDADKSGSNRQLVRAVCSHCTTVFEMRRELRGGHWVRMTDPVKLGRDAARRVRARIDYRERQAHALAS